MHLTEILYGLQRGSYVAPDHEPERHDSCLFSCL